jgi:hypothetical protein
MIGDTTSSFDPSLRGEQQDPYAFSIDHLTGEYHKERKTTRNRQLGMMDRNKERE